MEPRTVVVVKPVIDLQKRSIDFSISVFKELNNVFLPMGFSSLRDQLVRASTSIGANIIEGRGASLKKEMIRFYEIALRFANESLYWMMLIEAADSSNRLEKIKTKLHS